MTGARASRILGAAMAVPPLAWFAYQQGLGAVLRVDCAHGGGATGLICGLLAAAACIAAALCGRLGLRPAETDARRQTLRLLGVLTMSSAALFGLAIVYQAGATVIIPSCAR